jgi:hypothetical protein
MNWGEFMSPKVAVRRWLAVPFVAATLLGLVHCGGGSAGSRVSSESGALDVRVSAGGPVTGATVTVYAIADGNGQVNAVAGSLGVLGVGGPTDDSGKASVKLSVKSYSGPIQVVASGANLSYPDPTVPVGAGAAGPRVQIPSTFVLSSFIAQYTAGTSTVVPLTLLSTVVDRQALAYLRGAHPLHPGAKTLTEALAARDPLFVNHFTTAATAWSPTALRSTVPARLTDTTTTLVDAAYAALFDVGLNQLARDTAVRAGYGAGSSAITAITLAQLLEQDVDADGQFNGKGTAGTPIVTQGTTPVTLDSQFLRKPLAQALDTWFQNSSVNLSSIHQADLIGAQVFTAISTDASDLFGDPPSGSYNPVDRMPPVVTLVTEPPLYSRTPDSITLTMTADDPSGVKGVYVRVGSQRFSAAQQADGTWQVLVRLPLPGHNVITIWADDLSPSANSGLDGQPPYQLTRDILVDTTAPLPIYDMAFASYYDERGIAVSAQVPPTYTTGSKVAVPQGGHFYKVATRLSAAAQANAAELETTNVFNIPLLRFSVGFNSLTDAPITDASYTVNVTCPSPCPAFPDATGSLLASPSKTDQTVSYTLPLATEYVASLASVQGAATLAVTVTLVDAAGNRNSTTVPSFTFHVLGPPLLLSEDMSYAAANDGKSTFPYRMNQANFATLYDPGATIFGPENVVRLARYTITNPASQPVALSPSLVGAVWYDNETWAGASTSNGHAYYASPPGWVSPNPAWGLPMGACQYLIATYTVPGDLTTSSVQFSPCAAGAGAIFFPSGSSIQCGIDPGPASVSGPQASAPVSTLAYYGDGSAARVTAMGRYVVPAASSSVPGYLALYVVRLRAGLQARIPLTGWTGLNYVQSVGQEAALTATYRHPTSPAYGPCEYWNGGAWTSCPVFQYSLASYSRTLTAASDSVTGTLAIQTLGMTGAGSEFGEPQSVPGGSVDLTRSISH